MNHEIEHDALNDDDRHDPLANALRQQAHAARLAPSLLRREQTLAAIRSDSATTVRRRSRFVLGTRRSKWGFSFAAAAVLAMVIGGSWYIAHLIDPQPQPEIVSIGPVPPRPALPGATIASPLKFNPQQTIRETTANIRLARFTRPLEREAQALQTDFKRLSDRVRSALPKRTSRE